MEKELSIEKAITLLRINGYCVYKKSVAPVIRKNKKYLYSQSPTTDLRMTPFHGVVRALAENAGIRIKHFVSNPVNCPKGTVAYYLERPIPEDFETRANGLLTDLKKELDTKLIKMVVKINDRQKRKLTVKLEIQFAVDKTATDVKDEEVTTTHSESPQGHSQVNQASQKWRNRLAKTSAPTRKTT